MIMANGGVLISERSDGNSADLIQRYVIAAP
jgi:hypothetical protein